MLKVGNQLSGRESIQSYHSPVTKMQSGVLFGIFSGIESWTLKIRKFADPVMIIGFGKLRTLQWNA